MNKSRLWPLGGPTEGGGVCFFKKSGLGTVPPRPEEERMSGFGRRPVISAQKR